MKMKELTRAEEECMQVLWQLDEAFVKDIIEEMPKPKPAYNTVSTIVRILQDKGMVSHKRVGKSHRYYPLISREEYSRFKMENLMSGYFEGSLSTMVSFFMKEKKMNTKELDEIMKIIEKNKNQ